MKKLLTATLITLLTAAVLAASLSVFALAEAETTEIPAETEAAATVPAEELVELEYVRFTATGDDPYGTFHLMDNGDNTTIDPDEVVWAAVRYRSITQFDTAGAELYGQLYVVPPAEPHIPIKYVHSGQWETAIVDLTSVNENSELDSIWDSMHYQNVDVVRFDPMEPSRNAEADEQAETAGKVKKGFSIDVAWIAFFETEYAAKTYTGREKTPSAVLDADSLSSITDAYHMVATKLSEMAVLPTVAPATEPPAPTPTKAPTEAPVETALPTNDPAVNSAKPNGSGSATAPSNSGIKKDGGNKTGLIIGIIAAVVVACVCVVLALVIKKKKKSK